MFYYDESPLDVDIYDEADNEPVCVCPDYVGAKHVTFCHSCGMWTDDAELLKEAELPEIPAPVYIDTPVYQFAFQKKEEAA